MTRNSTVGALWINDQASSGLLVERVQVNIGVLAVTVLGGMLLLDISLFVGGHGGRWEKGHRRDSEQVGAVIMDPSSRVYPQMVILSHQSNK